MSTKRGQKSGLEGAASNGKSTAGTPSPANAWARPLQNKPRTSPTPPPGMGPADRANVPKKSSADAAKIADFNRDRLLHLSLTLVGQKVLVKQTNGAEYEGVFHTFTPFPSLSPEMKNKYVLKAVKTVKPPTEGENTIKDGTTAIIPVEKVLYVVAKNVKLDPPESNGGAGLATKLKNDVITDTQISGASNGRNRDLVAAGSAWTTGGNGGANSRAAGLAGGLEDKGGMSRKGFGTAKPSGLKGSIGEWDQFKANEKLFNVSATFDENLYTTQLDKSQIDSKKIAAAERLAKEIETTTSTNLHVAEERGHVVETDYDEEDRYSGVLTKDGKQRHENKGAPGAKSEETIPEDKAATPAPKKMMNYAAAAAKAGGEKKVAPPGFGGKGLATTTPEAKPEKAAKVTPDEKKGSEDGKTSEKKGISKAEQKDKPKDKTSGKNEGTSAAEGKKSDEKEGESKDKAEESKSAAKSSKLNANAKSFTFNPSAKSFTPSFGGGGGSSNSFSAPQQQPQQLDPNVGMQIHGGHPMQTPHYMHAPMGQPGMMPMMNPQYPGMRYPPQYGMEQHVPQMQSQHAPATSGQAPAQTTASPAPAPQSASATSSSPAPAGSEDGNGKNSEQEGEASQQQTPQQQQQQQTPQQQQQISLPYNVPPTGAYYPGGGMPMHPRGPSYPPQFVGGPQQMPVTPGGASYRQIYPMQPGMPPNMHMRGPSGQPYYPGPNGPMPYPPGGYVNPGMEGPDPRGGRGRGPGRGRGRRGGRGRGPGGRGGYQQSYGGGQQSDRRTPQQAPPAEPSAETTAQEGQNKATEAGIGEAAK